jgi:hypothetical protein
MYCAAYNPDELDVRIEKASWKALRSVAREKENQVIS